MIEYAKKYHGVGLSVMPISRDKIPTVKWKERETKLIEPAYEFNNCYGIGLICGKVSGNIEAIDIDCKYDLTGKLFENFKSQIPIELFNKLTIQTTANSGYHLLYKCEEIAGNKKLADREATTEEKKKGEKILVLIETRGEGGYVAVYPTPKYKFIQNHLHNIPQISTEERQELLNAALNFNEIPIKDYTQGDNCFQEYNERGDSLVLLQKHGWSIKHERGDSILLKRPGQTKSRWSAGFHKHKKCLYVFSKSTQFEELKAYSPVSIYAMLECNNDWKEAARRLKAEGYGLNGKPKEPKKETTPDELEKIISRARLDLNKEVEKPPVILKIKQWYGTGIEEQRVFTTGNFSVITGKSKAKKTYLATAISTSLLSGYFGNFVGCLPEGKEKVVVFDTEQGRYDAWVTGKRIEKLIGKQGNYEALTLREYSNIQRCEIIEYYLSKNKVGFVLIDGIADLAKAINDEEEATRVVGLLLKWSKIYNIHICCIIHQNKNDNFATGHLGSAIMKKSEAVISVQKIEQDKRASIIRCDLIRGVMDFDDFTLRINEKGLPEMETYEQKTDYSKPIEDLF